MTKFSRKKKKDRAEIVAAKQGRNLYTPHNDAHLSQNNNVLELQSFKYYLAALVSLITFSVYLPALQNAFVNWDDPVYVSANPHIHHLNLTFFQWAFFDYYEANWHPLTWISHALDYAVWGLNPLGHHLTNNVIHTINTFLVVVLFVKLLQIGKRTGTKNGAALFPDDWAILIAGGTAGLLFGLHPIHVESVAWITERKDLLCALFFLLSITWYAKYAVSLQSEDSSQRSTIRRQFLISLAFFVFALLSKPMAVTLPMVLLILDWYPLKRIYSLKSVRTPFLEKLPFMALSFISSILTIRAQNFGQAMSLMEFVPFSSRALVAAKALIDYIWKMICPLKLVPFYQHPKVLSLFSPAYILAIVLVVGITTVCIALVKKQKLFLSIWSYYVLTLIPVLGIVQVGGQAMADRYTYLPSIGLFLLMGVGTAWVLATVTKKWGLTSKLVTATAAVLLIVPLSLLTFKQIHIWKNSFTLWTYAIETEPGKASVAYKNRGVYYYERGEFDRAIEDYTKAIDLDPSYIHAYNNRGLAFCRIGRLDRAFADFNKALAINPTHFEALVNRGLAFDQAGQPEKAIEDYDAAIALSPSNHDVYNYRGIALDEIGRLDKAIADYDTALTLNPAFSDAYKNRAAAFVKMDQLDKAAADYDRVVALNPSDYNVYEEMGVLYGRRGFYDKATEWFNKAIAVNPNDYQVWNNRGFTYLIAKQYDRALQDFNRAIELNQNNMFAYGNRGNLYLKTGNIKLAISDFQKACALGNKNGCDALQSTKLSIKNQVK
jgi:protein O-mannosyl-transferase